MFGVPDRMRTPRLNEQFGPSKSPLIHGSQLILSRPESLQFFELLRYSGYARYRDNFGEMGEAFDD